MAEAADVRRRSSMADCPAPGVSGGGALDDDASVGASDAVPSSSSSSSSSSEWSDSVRRPLLPPISVVSAASGASVPAILMALTRAMCEAKSIGAGGAAAADAAAAASFTSGTPSSHSTVPVRIPSARGRGASSS